MTDTTPTAQPAKAMWTRCNGCQDRIYNNPHDIKIHRLHCPYDLQLALQRFRDRLDAIDNPKAAGSLINRIDYLEQQVGDLDAHISAEPALDPDAIDPDAFTATPADDDTAEDDIAPYPTTTPALAAVPASTNVYAPGTVAP